MEENSCPVYLYEVDDLLGGDALCLYDLAKLARKDIRWFSDRANGHEEQAKAA